MSPIIRNVVYDVRNNKHPRNLQEIIGMADKGLQSKRNKSPVRVNYKVKTSPLTEKPIFYTDKTRPYYH